MAALHLTALNHVSFHSSSRHAVVLPIASSPDYPNGTTDHVYTSLSLPRMPTIINMLRSTRLDGYEYPTLDEETLARHLGGNHRPPRNDSGGLSDRR